MFDPWTATYEEAEIAQSMFAPDTGLRDPIGPDSPIMQWFAVLRIKAQQSEIANGDGYSVLACVRDCLTHRLIAPDWLVYAYNRRFDAVLNCRAKSWDDPNSFGKPYPKGVHLNSLRKQRMLKPQVLSKAREILRDFPDTPIDASFFETIGNAVKPPIGKSEAARLYYSGKKLFEIATINRKNHISDK